MAMGQSTPKAPDSLGTNERRLQAPFTFAQQTVAKMPENRRFQAQFRAWTYHRHISAVVGCQRINYVRDCVMKRFAFLFVLSVCFSSPAMAFTNDSGTFPGLEFVAETEIPGPNDTAMSLCYVTEDLRILGYTVSSDITGYGLSDDGCNTSLVRLFSQEQMETAQSLNLVDASLPAVARDSTERLLQNYAIWVVLALALLWVIIRRLRSLLGLDPNKRLRKKASDRLLQVLCYTGKCDGMVASNEIAMIGQTYQRLTKRTVPAAEVIRITDHIEVDLSLQDFINFGRGLRDSEKDMMMRGAFYIALASGRILPSEHAFLSSLAHGIGMPGEDFRRVMNQSIADLDAYPPKL